MEKTDITEISIVIGTFNRSEMLRSALGSLMRQETDGKFTYEIIVVDDGSTDDTPETVARVSENSPIPLRYFRENGSGVASARNRGIREASGAWIAFFDDDQLANPYWLKELLVMAAKTNASCVGGAVKLELPPEKYRLLTPTCCALMGETVGRNKPERCDDRHHTLGTGNLMVKKSLFEETGAFDASLKEGGCDLDFFRRIQERGSEAWYTPSAVVNHMIPEYRLTKQYMIWKSKINGLNFALRDFRQHGLLRNVFTCIARIGQSMLINAPNFLWAGLTGNHGEKLGRECLLHRSICYARQTLRHVSPRLFPQTQFFKQYEFRNERQIFGKSGKDKA